MPAILVYGWQRYSQEYFRYTHARLCAARQGVSIVLRDRHAKQRSGRCADNQLVTNGSPFLMLHRLSRRQDTQTVPDLRENAMTGSFQPATTPKNDGLPCR